MSQEQETTMINEVLNEATLDETKVIIKKRKYNKKVKNIVVEEPVVEEPVAELVDEKVVEAVLEAEVVEVIQSQVVDYDSDDDDEEELIRQQELLRLKLEKKRSKKIEADRINSWTNVRPNLLKDKVKTDRQKLVAFLEKNNIPMYVVDTLNVDTDLFNGQDYDELEELYPSVKENYLKPGAPKKVNTNTNTNRVRITNRAPPTKRVRESRLLFQDREVVEHIATEKNTRTPLNRITAEFRLETNYWHIITDEHNTMIGKVVRNLNQFIIANNEIYAPEKVQKETAWAGSVKVNRDDVWISVGNINPL